MENIPKVPAWKSPLPFAALVLMGSLCPWTGVVYGRGTVQEGAQLRSEIHSVSEIQGQPSTVSAGGLTRGNRELVTLENDTAFDAGESARGVRRLVIIGGLSGDVESAYLALDAVRWF